MLRALWKNVGKKRSEGREEMLKRKEVVTGAGRKGSKIMKKG